MKNIFELLSILILVGAFNFACCQSENSSQWPQFRGPNGSGIMDGADLPDTWDIESMQNIKWILDIPGLGHSCPVIWDEKLFVTTAISGSGADSLKIGLYGDIAEVNDRSIHEFRLYCIDKHSGEIIWERLAHKGVPKTERHTKSSHANPTPATNGEYVLAFFGSDGLYCYNMNGDLLWEKDFGVMNAGPYTDPDVEWGFASSPIIVEDKVVIQCDFIGDSFIATLDIKTGNEIWRTGRDEISTWSTPNFIETDKGGQIVVNGWKHMGGYDLKTGQEIWKLSGGGDAPVPIPVFAHDMVYIHNAHGRSSPIFAIDVNAKGDITPENDKSSNPYIKWMIKRGGAYMPTIVVYGNYLYNLRMNGQLMCFDALSGEQLYKTRIPGVSGGITASGVCSDGKLYYCTEKGDVFIIKTGNEFKLISKNSMKDIIMATPAISENSIYFRTASKVIAVREKRD